MSEYIPRSEEAITFSTRDMGHEEMLKPREGKWNIVQVLEHLYLTYTGP